MAEFTVRTRVAMLIAVAIVALGLGYFLWPSSAPEPTGRAMGFVDTPAEKEQLQEMLREGRVRLVKPEEIDAMLTDEQRALNKRR
jgi:hypothetical protein